VSSNELEHTDAAPVWYMEEIRHRSRSEDETWNAASNYLRKLLYTICR